ncbi:hypothetical protein BJ875DRAFT_459559 [Amylocarpus encephaloides]|uniref:Uncharacterized protein n=1 Tax=Amylocarpus encephaloides TaxID=45428 RepID=A0A9P8C6F4_9HELO|nr:hypothetical protein BJ875DRAFT_459559 [Amylocarpus encephaloides]
MPLSHHLLVGAFVSIFPFGLHCERDVMSLAVSWWVRLLTLINCLLVVIYFVSQSAARPVSSPNKIAY